MATSPLMTGKHLPHFGLYSLISTLSFGEIFSYFATSWKWYCLTFWIGKKSRLFRRFFQYSVICQFSKYIAMFLVYKHASLLIFKFSSHWTIACIVSTANKPLVGALMTIGDVTRNIAIRLALTRSPDFDKNKVFHRKCM